MQRVSLVPDRTHNMRTLSLKPLLFGEFPVSAIEIYFYILNLEVLSSTH